MGHPLSGARETWLAPNVQSSCGTRHLPTALPDAEFGDLELGPLWMRHMLRNATFCPLFGPFYPHFAIQSAFQSGRGLPLSATQGKRVATFALVTTVGPQPRPARSTPGEPARAADRQAFASLSYPTDRQVLRNPHVGRPGFLVSMSIHPRTAARPGRHAGLLLTPNCQSRSARSRHT
jgi:hypothetical protein